MLRANQRIRPIRRLHSGIRPLEVVQSILEKASSVQKQVSPDLFANNATLARTPALFKATFCIIQKTPGDTDQDYFKKLLKLTNLESTDYLVALMLGSAMLGVANPNITIELNTILQECSVIVDYVTINEFILIHPSFNEVDLGQLEDYQGMEAPHYDLPLVS